MSTNFDNGIRVDGTKMWPTPTNYKVIVDATNATPLQVTGGMSATSGAITTVNATTGNITTVAATTVNATTGNITTVAATTVNASNSTITTLLSAGAATVTNAINAGSVAITGACNAGSATITNTMSAGNASITGSCNAGGAVITNAVNAGSGNITNALTTGTLKIGASGDVINSILTLNAAINVASINAGVMSRQQATVTGIAATDKVLSAWPTNYIAYLGIVGVSVSAANTLQIDFYNADAGNALDPAEETFNFLIVR